MNWAQYNKRRDAYAARVQQMIEYIKATTCRSAFINSYFGDETAPCGCCDNSLRAKNTELSSEEFQAIYATLKSKLAAAPLSVTALLQDLNNAQKEKAWKVIRFLQAEKKLHADKHGLLKMVTG